MRATICGSRRSVTAIQAMTFTSKAQQPRIAPKLSTGPPRLARAGRNGSEPRRIAAIEATGRCAGSTGPNEGKERVDEPAAAGPAPASLNLLTPRRDQ